MLDAILLLENASIFWVLPTANHQHLDDSLTIISLPDPFQTPRDEVHDEALGSIHRVASLCVCLTSTPSATEQSPIQSYILLVC